MSVTAFSRSLLEKARSYGVEPLLSLADGKFASLADGYSPLLVNFSFEDKEAKGLRKLQDQAAPEPAVYFSGSEMVRDHAALILCGETGSGKTTFARHLAFRLSRGETEPTLLPRNDQGAVHPEDAALGHCLPLYCRVTAGISLAALVEAAEPGAMTILAGDAWAGSDATLLLILDGLEAAGTAGPALLAEALAVQARVPRIRLLALGESAVVKGWALPLPFVRFDLLPLLKVQRRDVALRLRLDDPNTTGLALGDAAANPAQFAMAIRAGDPGRTAESITDAWLSKTAGDVQAAAALCSRAFEALAGQIDLPDAAMTSRVCQMLAARHLLPEPADAVVGPFRAHPALWKPVVRSLAARLAGSSKAKALIEALITGDGDDVLRGALLAADLLTDQDRGQDPVRERVSGLLLAIVEAGSLTASEREQAGRLLSVWGDPRDLQALARVPGGLFRFGSSMHPSSAPPNSVMVADFRIGLYPVVNADYGAFVHETGRLWRSPDGHADDRRNAPATNLTWHDARAYCAWLTMRWRSEGRINDAEVVRLPTEPEWERAARGDQPDAGDGVIIYPWGAVWIDDAANSEEAGFNDTCTVGLFPEGRSPYGCYDMAGQVWEWGTTLWGEDMATPSFQYPYVDDGREALNAAPTVRRVLRGGCFSSGKLKACCTYRGSLEPDGFWRGNGFRIVVARTV